MYLLHQQNLLFKMPKGGDTQRKEWDKDEYRQKAKERERNYHKKVEIPVDKSTLAVLEARQEISTLALQGLNEKKTVSSIDAVPNY